ncbi:MAG: pantetheine-phosphate adenylyltransferase [Anaerolineales bacterium]|nr:MAG: pantetheine-phosphate adenylyltransferase [Anaerolineales bacterium]
MTRAIYPATFDPITLGHIDIATRAAALFSELIVAVYDRPLKSLLFSPEERWHMTRDALDHLPNVRIERYTGMTVEFARQQQATVIVRGLRVLSDFEWEFQLALTNRSLASDIDTICLMTSQEYSFLSSSVVKEIAFAGGDTTSLVPPHVTEVLHAKIRELGGDGDSKVKLVSLRD